MIGRWIADYDDPDNFTLQALPLGDGPPARATSRRRRRTGSSRRRAPRPRPAAREALYRKFERRAARVRGSSSRSSTTWTTGSPARSVRGLRSTRPRPTSTTPSSARPEVRRRRRPRPRRSAAACCTCRSRASCAASTRRSPATVEQADVLPSVFETLTRARRRRADRALARRRRSRWRTTARGSASGCSAGVRFHDGRRLTARDVRYSFERLLLNRESESRWVLSRDPGRPAPAGRRGRRTSRASTSYSPTEFVIELEKPVPFFPALISYAGDGHRARGHRRDRRERARGRDRDRALPGRRLRARAAARAGAQPHLLARGAARAAKASSSASASRPRRSARVPRRALLARVATCCPADAEALRHDPRVRARGTARARA